MTIYPDFDALWDYSAPAETREAFEASRDAIDPSDRDLALQLDTQIARTHGLERDFSRAHEVLDLVDGALDEATPVARVRSLLERGRVWRSSGEPERGCSLFIEAFERARDAGYHGYAVDAAHMLGIALEGELGLGWNLDAIAYAERHPDDTHAQRWLGALYNNTAWSLHDLSRFDDALDLFERGLALRVRAGAVDPILIARWSVARCLRSLGDISRALSLQLALRQTREELGRPGGYVFEELGELYALRGDDAKARAAFARAHELLSQDTWFASNEAARLARMLRLAHAE